MQVLLQKVANINPNTLEIINAHKIETHRCSNLLFSNLPDLSEDALEKRFDKNIPATIRCFFLMDRTVLLPKKSYG